MLAALCFLISPSHSHAADTTTKDNTEATPITFRIGTGGSAGTYLPIGLLIASAISGAGEIHKNTPYFEPNLVAIAQRSTGSVGNVLDISAGLLEAGFAQADVVHWAATGKGPFEFQSPRTNLRSIATLYLESVHLVVRTDSNINSVHDLIGRRVSVDEKGSGTLLAIKPILNALQMRIDSLKTFYIKTNDAVERLRKDELDAIFMVAGYPVMAVSELVAEGKARVIPIAGHGLEDISDDYPFFTIDSIPANTYQNTEAIPTLGVPAQLITKSEISDDLVYNITSMLWNSKTLDILSAGHPKGKDVQLQSAVSGTRVSLHPGAERFYREKGLLDE